MIFLLFCRSTPMNKFSYHSFFKHSQFNSLKILVHFFCTGVLVYLCASYLLRPMQPVCRDEATDLCHRPLGERHLAPSQQMQHKWATIFSFWQTLIPCQGLPLFVDVKLLVGKLILRVFFKLTQLLKMIECCICNFLGNH